MGCLPTKPHLCGNLFCFSSFLAESQSFSKIQIELSPVSCKTHSSCTGNDMKVVPNY